MSNRVAKADFIASVLTLSSPASYAPRGFGEIGEKIAAALAKINSDHDFSSGQPYTVHLTPAEARCLKRTTSFTALTSAAEAHEPELEVREVDLDEGMTLTLVPKGTELAEEKKVITIDNRDTPTAGYEALEAAAERH